MKPYPVTFPLKDWRFMMMNSATTNDQANGELAIKFYEEYVRPRLRYLPPAYRGLVRDAIMNYANVVRIRPELKTYAWREVSRVLGRLWDYERRKLGVVQYRPFSTQVDEIV